MGGGRRRLGGVGREVCVVSCWEVVGAGGGAAESTEGGWAEAAWWGTVSGGYAWRHVSGADTCRAGEGGALAVGRAAADLRRRNGGWKVGEAAQRGSVRGLEWAWCVGHYFSGVKRRPTSIVGASSGSDLGRELRCLRCLCTLHGDGPGEWRLNRGAQMGRARSWGRGCRMGWAGGVALLLACGCVGVSAQDTCEGAALAEYERCVGDCDGYSCDSSAFSGAASCDVVVSLGHLQGDSLLPAEGVWQMQCEKDSECALLRERIAEDVDCCPHGRSLSE